MNSCPAVTEDAVRTHFVAEAGIAYAPDASGDPLQAWLDLMEVVEALCSHWPQRQRSPAVEYRM